MVRRNKIQFTAVVFMASVLIGAVAISSWQALRARRAEREQARQRALAEQRLQTTLGFFDRTFQDVAANLWELIGAAKISENLATNSVALLEQLQAGDSENAEFRRLLGQLYVQLALVQGWPSGNNAWDPEASLKAATEAIRLLAPAGTDGAKEERIGQLVRAEMIAAGDCAFLQKWDDAIAHYRQLGLWLPSITNRNSFYFRGFKSLNRSGEGWVLLRMGRAGEALTNYLRPVLEELQALPPTNEFPEAALLAKAHKFVGQACLELGQKEEALIHSREALRLVEVLTGAYTNSAEFAVERAWAIAQLGESLLALYEPDGLERLNQALDLSRNLTERDPENTGFILTRILILRHFAQGATAWAADPSATQTTRLHRLRQAGDHLREAENLSGKLRSESARKALRFELEPARSALAAATAKMDKHNEL